jgi:arylsulfatase A-like enzyme
LVALTDVIATVAELTGTPLPHDAGEDSFSFLHVLNGAPPTQPVRKSVIMDSYAGVFAIREAQWKLIDGPGGGTWGSGGGGLLVGSDPGEYPVQLYDLSSDPGERVNLYMKHPEIASRLRGKLREIKYGGRSR